MTTPAAILDLLEARHGVVCAVGAGGKKSLLGWIARHHPGPVALTATVHTVALGGLADERVCLGTPDAIAAWLEDGPGAPVAFAAPPEKGDRWAGLPVEAVARLHAAGRFAATLVKADGARMRLVKAPNPGEPSIPPGARTVLPLVSARAIGRPLDERTVHRPERLAPLVGAAPGETLTPDHIGRLLAAPGGALQNVGDARVVPVINMVDDDSRRASARAAARAALDLCDRFERVLLMRLHDDEMPLIEVVERQSST